MHTSAPQAGFAARLLLPRHGLTAAWLTCGAVFVFLVLAFPGLLNDQFMHLAWAQQVNLGAWPGRDFVDPGMPLQYLLSALAMRVVPGPLPEVFLTAACLAVAAGLTCLGVAALARSTAAGVAAALVQVAIEPRLYSYPKVLVPAMLLVLGLLYARDPSRWPRVALAAGVAVAFLFRHDLGIYAAAYAAVVAAVTAPFWRERLREVVRLGALALLVLAPWLLYVQLTEGLLLHVHQGVEFLAGESGFRFPWPGVAIHAGDRLSWTAGDAAALLFYVAYVLPVGSVLLLLRRRRHLPDATAAAVAGMAAVTIGYDVLILRTPLEVRVPDLAAPFAILGTWGALELYRWIRAAPPRAAGPAVARVALAGGVLIALAAVGTVGHVGTQWLRTGLLSGPGAAAGRLAGIVADGTTWPWRSFWPGGEQPAVIEYLHACTAPDDRFFTTWFAPEYYVFAERGFAAGHEFLLPPAFTSPADQQRTLARLARERVPVVLLHEGLRQEFETGYPLLADHLREWYREAGTFTLPNDAGIAVLVRRDWTADGTFADTGWPCGLAPPTGSS